MNLFVLGSYYCNSSLIKILQDKEVGDASFYNDRRKLVLPADSAFSPFLFKIDKSGRIKNVIFLQKEYSQVTTIYCDMLQREENIE